MGSRWKPLFDARQGLPDEARAARVIATYAVIPAAVAGILGGAWLVPVSAPFSQLLLYGSLGALGAGALVLFAILGLYWLAGFRPVVFLADTLIGAAGGLFVGGLADDFVGVGWLPIAGAAVGAIALPELQLLLPRAARRSARDEDSGPAA